MERVAAFGDASGAVVRPVSSPAGDGEALLYASASPCEAAFLDETGDAGDGLPSGATILAPIRLGEGPRACDDASAGFSVASAYWATAPPRGI